MKGTKLKKIRKGFGFTQVQMAERLGYESGAIISQLERGHRTITGVASKCIKYLEIILNKKQS
jgi:transcriptional regulator with XRE-family HTH domain